jgi:hypothetical protein
MGYATTNINNKNIFKKLNLFYFFTICCCSISNATIEIITN